LTQDHYGIRISGNTDSGSDILYYDQSLFTQFAGTTIFEHNQVSTVRLVRTGDESTPCVEEAILKLEGYFEEFDLLSEPIDIIKSYKDEATLKFKIHPNGRTIKNCLLRQGANIRIEADGHGDNTWEFNKIRPGIKFIPIEPIYFVIETDTNEIPIPIELKIQKDPSMGDKMLIKKDSPQQETKKTPLFEEEKFGLNIPCVPISVIWDTGSTYTVLVGVAYDRKSKEKEFISGLKLIEDELRSMIDKTAKWGEFLAEKGVRGLECSGSSCVKTGISVMGFFKFTEDKNGIRKLTDAKLIILMNGSVAYTMSFYLGPIPGFLAALFSCKMSASYSFMKGITENVLDLLVYNGIKNEVFVEFEAGIGFKGVLSISIAAFAKITYQHCLLPRGDSTARLGEFVECDDESPHSMLGGLVDDQGRFLTNSLLQDILKGEITVGYAIRYIVFLFFAWEYKKETKPYPFLDNAEEDVLDQLPCELYDMSLFSPRPLPDLFPKWVGDEAPLLSLGHGKSEQELVNHLIDTAEPQYVTWKRSSLYRDYDFVFWIDIRSNPTEHNRTVLKYAVRETKTEGIFRQGYVFDCQTNDVAFHAANCNGDLWIAWQNVNDHDPQNLQEMCEKSRIFVAKYDPDEEKFVDRIEVSTGGGNMDPKLASDGSDFAVFYINNPENDAFRQLKRSETLNTIKCRERGWGKWEAAYDLLSTRDTVQSYSVAMDGSKPVIAVITEQGKNINNRTLKIYRGSKQNDIIIAQSTFLSYPRFGKYNGKMALFWYQKQQASGSDHHLFYLGDVFDLKGAICPVDVFEKTPDGMSDNYDLVTDYEENVDGILSIKSTGRDTSIACLSLYNEKTKKMGSPFPIIEPVGCTVGAAHGLIHSNKTVRMVYRRDKYVNGKIDVNNSALVVAHQEHGINLRLNDLKGSLRVEHGAKWYNFSFNVTNHGTKPSKGIGYAVFKETTQVHAEDVEQELFPGELVNFFGKYPSDFSSSIENFKLQFWALQEYNKAVYIPCENDIADVAVHRVFVKRDKNDKKKRISAIRIVKQNFVPVKGLVLQIKEDGKTDPIYTSEAFSIERDKYLYELTWVEVADTDNNLHLKRTYNLLHQNRLVDSHVSYSVNSFCLNTFTPTIREFIMDEQCNIKLAVAVKNNHPTLRTGDLVVNIVNEHTGQTVASGTIPLKLGANAGGLVSDIFHVQDGDPNHAYTAYVTIDRNSLEGSPEPVPVGIAALASDCDEAEADKLFPMASL